jgi:hydrogenase-4 component E
VVIFAFNLATPIAKLSASLARGTLGIALACVLLSFLMMITRAKAVPQVIGFLAMENGLFFAATSATYGTCSRSASSSTAWTSTTSKS